MRTLTIMLTTMSMGTSMARTLTHTRRSPTRC